MTTTDLAALADAWEDCRLKNQSLLDALRAASEATPEQLAVLHPSRRRNIEAMAEAWFDGEETSPYL